MRQKIKTIICLAMAFVLLAGCGVIQARTPKHGSEKTTHKSNLVQATTQNNPDSVSTSGATTTAAKPPKPVFLHAAQEGEPGLPKFIMLHNENYAYGVYYPFMDNKSVDAQIEVFAKSIADEFDESVKGSLDDSERERVVMQADYKAYRSTDAAAGQPGSYHLLSVVFEIFPDVHGSGAKDKKIKTLLFDLKTGKRLMAADVFGRDYPAVISQQIVATLAEKADYAEHTKTEFFLAKTSPKAENFLSFAFIDGQAVFYFDAARILPAEFGCISACVPVTQLYKILKIKVSDRAPFRMFDTQEKMIALTFDDGPKTENTARILDALDKVEGRATFFVLGMMVDANADVMKRAYLAGSDIENHSYNHKKMVATMSEADILFQLTQCDKKIKNVTGVNPSFFRIPYGFKNANAYRLADRPIIGWSIDTRDWVYSDTNKKNRSPQERNEHKQKVITQVLADVKDGDIVLMHDIHLFSTELCEALIPELTARGYKLVTVNELFAARGVTLVSGAYYSSARK
ncbi:MAG TPA: polysaccharide deacetylase family protein [Clostridia bacterium]|nr:polysaccharide deacetylase family protein [Clostridia bacterium]